VSCKLCRKSTFYAIDWFLSLNISNSLPNWRFKLSSSSQGSFPNDVSLPSQISFLKLPTNQTSCPCSWSGSIDLRSLQHKRNWVQVLTYFSSMRQPSIDKNNSSMMKVFFFAEFKTRSHVCILLGPVPMFRVPTASFNHDKFTISQQTEYCEN
jgi:hypothetical protein